MVNAPGKTLLLISGILLVIIGALSILIFGLTLAGLLAGDSLGIGEEVTQAITDSGTDKDTLIVGAIIFIVAGLWALVVGILGIKNRAVLEKAQLCLVLGVIFIVLALVGVVLQAIGGAEIQDLALGLIDLVLPLVFVAGAIMNKKALSQQQG
ncbi:MAG: hypothetical protein FWG14_00745 [Peptococcaceae bacterium]|nr:hypothetical protein [Peptococcaceae bacterium]